MKRNINYSAYLRRTSIFLFVSVVVIAVAIIYLRVSYTRHTDCEIARIWYDIDPASFGSFETYLEERFRIFDIIEPDGLFADQRYNVAIRHPERDNNRIKSYFFLLSKEGVISSQMSISISIEAWNRGRKVICAYSNGDGT